MFVHPVAFRFTNSFHVGITYSEKQFRGLWAHGRLSLNLNLFSSAFPILLEIIPFIVCVCVFGVLLYSCNVFE